MYESLLQLLRASLPEFLGSLMAATVIATAAWSVKKTRDRMRTRRVRVDALPPTERGSGDTDHQQAA